MRAVTVGMGRVPGAGTWRLFRLLLGVLLGALAGFFTGARAFAQEVVEEAPEVGGSVAGYGAADWLNLALRLGLVLVVIWLAIVAMRWWVRRMHGTTTGGSGRVLEVLESRSLGPNRSLQLVRLGNRAVLLGVTTDRINAVLEVTDPLEVERLATPPVTPEPTSFRDAISRLGSLTRRSPERKNSPALAQGGVPAAVPAAVPQGGVSPMPGAGVQAPQVRSRWLTTMRWVIGLERSPRGGPRTTEVRAAAAQMRAPAGVGATNPGARAPIMGVPGGSPARSSANQPRMSPAERATLAAELPASRASRARSGYRQNQIAEAQRAITSVRELRSS